MELIFTSPIKAHRTPSTTKSHFIKINFYYVNIFLCKKCFISLLKMWCFFRRGVRWKRRNGATRRSRRSSWFSDTYWNQRRGNRGREYSGRRPGRKPPGCPPFGGSNPKATERKKATKSKRPRHTSSKNTFLNIFLNNGFIRYILYQLAFLTCFWTQIIY